MTGGAIEPLSNPAVMSWDWRGQPDLDELARLLLPYGVHLHQVDTGSDEYAIVLADAPLDTAAVRDAYRRRWDGDE